MKVLVGIPTYNNVASGYSIKGTLEGLANQKTETDFSVCVVLKPSTNDRTVEVIESYNHKLNLSISFQHEGYIEEAMNMILGASAGYDLLLLIDDDAIPNTHWVQHYVNLFTNFVAIGIASRMFNQERQRLIQYGRKLLTLNRALTPRLSDYYGRLNDIGLLEDSTYPSDAIILSLNLRGANMCVRSALVRDFRLPCASLRGIRYESLIGLHVVEQGYESVILRGGYEVDHEERNSLSRPSTEKGIYGTSLECNLTPYAVNLQHEINMNKLSAYLNAVRLYSQVMPRITTRAWTRGLEIAHSGITEYWSPETVRNAVIKSIEAFR